MEKVDAAMVSQEEGTASSQAPVVEGTAPSIPGETGDTGSMNNAGTPGDMSTDETEDSSILQRAQEILEAMGYRKGVQESVSEKVQDDRAGYQRFSGDCSRPTAFWRRWCTRCCSCCPSRC